jgi:hypothetical protein
MSTPETPPGSPLPPPVAATSIMETMLSVLKWVFYAAVICGLLYAIWKYRAELLATVAGWAAAFREFWRSLFSGRRFDEDAPELVALHSNPSVAFSEFTDPFAQGMDDRYGSAELVQYTFAALQAWGREHGVARDLDQTPHEFAIRLGGQVPELAPDAAALASLYGRAVYSTGALPSEYVANLARLWRYLRAHALQPASAPIP